MVNFIGNIGFNHNADLKAMKTLMKLGAEAGFNYLKFNTCDTIDFDMFEIHEIFKYANELNIKLYCSIDNVITADLISQYTDICEIPLEKNTDNELINYIRSRFKNIIFSIDNIEFDYLEDLYYSYGPQMFLFNATENNCNTKSIKKLLLLNNVKFGFKYECNDLIPHIVALTNGCEFIERNITLCKELKGDNHKNSLEPNEYGDFIDKLEYANSLC